MTTVASAVGLDELLAPCRREVTGLVAVTLRDGRMAELWLDRGRVSYLTCPGIPSLEDRLRDCLPPGGWADALGRAEGGSGLVVELVQAGVGIDTIKDRLGELGREVVDELGAVGIAEIQVAESVHPFQGSGWVDLPALTERTAPTPPTAADPPVSGVRLVAGPMPDAMGEIRLDAARWAVALALAAPGDAEEVTARTGLPRARVEDAMARLHRVGLLREAGPDDEPQDDAPTAPLEPVEERAAGPSADDRAAYTSTALRHLIEGVREL